MSKKLWKKALTAVLTAALLMTNSGVASLNASAAEKVYIEGVYTNFQKATMATGTTRQINAYVQPENATVQRLQYKSSNDKVATVSIAGLITAVAPGTATITVKALDGSSQEETIKVTVLKDLFLTNKNVDNDNEIIVLDQTYGNVTIDSSVGDANVYLAGITVRNNLTLENGEYTVTMYDSTANRVVFDEKKDEIVSLAVEEAEEEKAPKLIVGNNTNITEIEARINATIRQEDGSQIDGLSFIQDQEGNITIYLDGYHGELLLDASLGDMNIVLSNSNIGKVSVSGGDKAGNIRLSNGGDATISSVTLNGKAKLDLAVPTDEVTIDKKANGSTLKVSDTVGTVNNAGTASKISVAGSVDNFTTEGPGADIDVNKGGYVGTVQVNGTATIYGAGEVSEAYVNADYCRIDTINTLVNIGNAQGTLVQGVEAKSGSSVATKPPVAGGGGGAGAEQPEKKYKVGDIILKNDFEDGKNELYATMGSPSMKIVDGGKDSAKALLVSGKTANWNGVGMDFAPYVGKHITLMIKANIKGTEDGDLFATITHDGKYSSAGSVKGSKADTWYTIEGTFELGSDVKTAKLYFESPGTSNYYLDNVSITIHAIGDAIRVNGVGLDQSSLTLDMGASAQLKATINPANADNREVTWSTTDSTVATVTNGIVKAIKPGTATIKATTVDGGFIAECEVTVTSNVSLALNYGTVILDSIGASKVVLANVTEGVNWASADTSIATVSDGTITATGLGTTTVTATLGDKIVSCDVVVDDTIIYYEDFEDDAHNFTYATWAITETLMTSEEDAYNGNKYLRVENKNKYNGYTFTLDNSSGTLEAIYNITTFVKADSADLGVEYFHDDSSLGYTITKVTSKATEWVTLRSADLKVAAGKTIKVRLISSELGTYYMDDLYITKKVSGGSVEPSIGTVIASDSFEADDSYSLKGTIGNGLEYVDGGYNSSKSLKVTTADSGWGNPGFDLLPYKGKTVTVIAYMKHDEAAGQKLSATLQLTKADDTVTYPGTGLDASGGWTKFVLEVEIPSDAKGANFYFEKAYQQTVSVFYLDNVLIYEGPVAAAEAEHAKLFAEDTTIYLSDAKSPTYGLSIAASAISGSAITIDGVDNVVAISGGAIKAEGDWKLASINIGEEYVGKTVNVSVKVRRDTAGNLAWQLNSDGYPSVAVEWGANANTWYELSGSYEIPKPCTLFFSAYDDPSSYMNTIYYLADFVVTIED